MEIRQAYAATFNNDLHAICEDLRRRERKSDPDFRSPVQRKLDETTERESAVTRR